LGGREIVTPQYEHELGLGYEESVPPPRQDDPPGEAEVAHEYEGYAHERKREPEVEIELEEKAEP
jgi:hypothetical protein